MSRMLRKAVSIAGHPRRRCGEQRELPSQAIGAKGVAKVVAVRLCADIGAQGFRAPGDAYEPRARAAITSHVEQRLGRVGHGDDPRLAVREGELSLAHRELGGKLLDARSPKAPRQ